MTQGYNLSLFQSNFDDASCLQHRSVLPMTVSWPIEFYLFQCDILLMSLLLAPLQRKGSCLPNSFKENETFYTLHGAIQERSKAKPFEHKSFVESFFCPVQLQIYSVDLLLSLAYNHDDIR